MRALISTVKKYPLATFFILTFGLFWVALPLTLISPALLGLIGSFAPSLAVIIITALISGRSEVRALVSKLGMWRVGLGWYLVAAGIPVLVSWLILGSAAGLGGTPALQVGAVLPFIPVIYILAAGEELGWRGYALPKLLSQRPAFMVAMLLGVIHAFYHLPLWIAPGFPTPSYSFLSFLVTSLALGVIWTWLYQHTRGSVIIATVFHGTFNVAGNLFFAGLEPSLLSWLMPLGYGLVAAGLVALTGLGLVHKSFV